MPEEEIKTPRCLYRECISFRQCLLGARNAIFCNLAKILGSRKAVLLLALQVFAGSFIYTLQNEILEVIVFALMCLMAAMYFEYIKVDPIKATVDVGIKAGT